MSTRFLTRTSSPFLRRFTRCASTSAGWGSRQGAFAASVLFAAGVVTGASVDLYGRSRGATPAATPNGDDSTPGNPEPKPPSATQTVWRGTFDPGSNPRLTSQKAAPGPKFYDTVDSPDGVPGPGLTLWQQTLRAEDMKRTNFSELDRNGDGYLEKEDLIKAFGKGADVDKLIKAADTNGAGQISYKDWLVLKAKLEEAYERDRQNIARANGKE